MTNALQAAARYLANSRTHRARADARLRQAEGRWGDEFIRLRALIQAGQGGNLPGCKSSGEDAYWDVVIEGNVYHVYEFMEEIRELTFARRATVADFKAVIPLKKAKS